MREQLITALTSVLSTSTQFKDVFKVATQLPWDESGNPLYLKNMKSVYFGPDRREEVTLIPTIYGAEVFRDDIICNAYLAVDAKKPPTNVETFASAVVTGVKSKTGITNFGVESDYTAETQEDVLLYTFEFRMNTITY